jgi:integrase
MATFKIEIQNKRADGTYNLRIRITHGGEVRRISTNLYASAADLTKGGKIKNAVLLGQANALVNRCIELCNSFGYEIQTLTVAQLSERVKNALSGSNTFELDFMDYIKSVIKKRSSVPDNTPFDEIHPSGTCRNYKATLNALRRYTGKESLDISEINKSFLTGFEKFIKNEPSQRGHQDKPKGSRAVSLYLSYIRLLYNSAKDKYNDEERSIIPIPFNPFKSIKIRYGQTRKRALPLQTLQAIIDLPYTDGGKWNRFNLAKDCFLLSFCLIGMNSADLYSCSELKDNIITYNRQKTASRREDKAKMLVRIEPCIAGIFEKYKGDSEKLFCFHSRYSNADTFNSALNLGLKQIGKALEIEDLEYYAARHSWATIARSTAVGIDKYTVHEALNHFDETMRITDIYIARDWALYWEANRKVLSLFKW